MDMCDYSEDCSLLPVPSPFKWHYTDSGNVICKATEEQKEWVDVFSASASFKLSPDAKWLRRGGNASILQSQKCHSKFFHSLALFTLSRRTPPNQLEVKDSWNWACQYCRKVQLRKVGRSDFSVSFLSFLLTQNANLRHIFFLAESFFSFWVCQPPGRPLRFHGSTAELQTTQMSTPGKNRFRVECLLSCPQTPSSLGTVPKSS